MILTTEGLLSLEASFALSPFQAKPATSSTDGSLILGFQKKVRLRLPFKGRRCVLFVMPSVSFLLVFGIELQGTFFLLPAKSLVCTTLEVLYELTKNVIFSSNQSATRSARF
jgi:hypothetical protein